MTFITGTGIEFVDAPELRKKWGWMVAFGVLLALAGFVALGCVVTATVASIYIIGIAMIASGVVEIIYGFAMRSWKKFFLWILIGLCYVIAGISVFENPLFAAGFLTLLVGAGLVASGLVRLFLAFNLPANSPRFFVGLSAALSLAVGILILMQWPASSLWVIGTFLGVDLLLAGGSWIGVGLSLRRAEAAAA